MNISIASCIAACVTAIATVCAVYWAHKAYKESLLARKSAAFSTLFAQLINNHNSLFRNTSLKTTVLTNKGHEINGFTLTENDDNFTNFYNYCIDRKVNTNANTLIKTWDDYVKKIKENVLFSHCFKFVFNEIETVLHTFDNDQDKNDKEERKHYLEIIQANMSHAELFSYFINLLQHYLKKCGYKKDENGNYKFSPTNYNIEKDSFLTCLGENDFFHDLKIHSDTNDFVNKLWSTLEIDERDPLYRILKSMIQLDSVTQPSSSLPL